MKIFVSLVLALALAGCAKTNTATVPQTVAPGYQNITDQQLGEVLVGAHSFYATIQQDVAAGKYTPASAEKTALNNFATSLNVAQTIYLGYHAGVNTLAQAQAAVTQVQTQQTQLQTTLTGGK